jgi:release factor glutamine methyltransferase
VDGGALWISPGIFNAVLKETSLTDTISATALAQAVVALRAAGCVFAEDEAAVLREAAADETALDALVRRRAEGEPLEQVVGYADFCGIRVRLRPGVFVPRVRSELLVRLAVEAVPSAGVVVDLCCGSGALGMAVAAHAPNVVLYAADVEPAAVECARDNLGKRDVYQGDLFDALPAELAGRIDVLLANVPYVATRHIPLLPAEARDHEPHSALDGGGDGLDVFRRVVAAAPRWLAPGGVLLSEITEAQLDPATAAIRAAGLHPDSIHDEELEATAVRARSGRLE